jgi:lipooligosaccharide transport system permease protein
MMTGFGEASWPVFGAIKWQGTYHAMLATPMRTRDILAGHIAQVGWQLAAGAAAFVALAAPFGVWRSWWVLAAVPVATLTGLGFATVMTAVAARSETEGWFTAIFRVVATPLMLFSGTYFPIESLPPVLQPLAWVTPLWHGVEACRAFATGLVDGGAVLGHVAALVGFCAVGVAWSARELHRRLVR